MFPAAADGRRSDTWTMSHFAAARTATRPALAGRPRRRRSSSVPRLAIVAAAAVVIVAAAVLRWAQRLYDAGLLNLGGIEGAVRLSRRVRGFGRRLLHG